MAIRLERRPIQVIVHDVDGVREWLMQRIREEVRTQGSPRPRIVGLLPGFEETFDLGEMAERYPTAHPGATFQALRSRKETVRRFVVFLGIVQQEDSTQRTWAVLVEECDRFDGRKWWMGMLEFRTDPASGLGIVEQPWETWPGETSDLSGAEFIRAFVQAPPGAQPAPFLPPPDFFAPDIKFTFGELQPNLPTPNDAKQMIEITEKMVARDLLTSKLKGTVIVRLSGRSFEVFVVGDDVTDPIEEIVRYVANRRLPQADAVALACFAVRPDVVTPEPGLQIVAEVGGKFAEYWAHLDFPDGPKGRPHATKIDYLAPKAVPDGGMWIGVEPNVTFFEAGPEA
jgi:hypothetical protein